VLAIVIALRPSFRELIRAANDRITRGVCVVSR
jgi:hypothetical protein